MRLGHRCRARWSLGTASITVFAAEPQPPQGGVYVAPQVGARSRGRGWQRPNDQRASWPHGSQPVSEHVAEAAGDPVADHRVTDRLAHHEPDPGSGAGISQRRVRRDCLRPRSAHAEASDLLGRDGMHDEPGTPNTAALPGHEPKVVATGQSTGRGEQALRLRCSCGPCADEPRGSPCRHGCACADGTRGSAHGGGCSAGKYACSRLNLPNTGSSKYVCPRRGLTARRTHPQLTGDLHRVRHPVWSACIRVYCLQVCETTRRHAKYVGCLPTTTSCGMRHGLLACVSQFGQREWEPTAPRKIRRGL